MVSAMESRVVLVDISRAMGKDLEVAKKQLLSTQHRTFQVTVSAWRADTSEKTELIIVHVDEKGRWAQRQRRGSC